MSCMTEIYSLLHLWRIYAARDALMQMRFNVSNIRFLYVKIKSALILTFTGGSDQT